MRNIFGNIFGKIFGRIFGAGQSSGTLIPQSYELAVIDHAVRMLEGSPTWQEICAPRAARERIILFHGGDYNTQSIDGAVIDPVPPYARLDSKEFPSKIIGIGFRRRSGVVTIAITLTRPDDLVFSLSSAWAISILSAIAKEIAAQKGQPGKLGNVRTDWTYNTLPDPTGALARSLTGTVRIEWRNTP
jgi:hypothetical protein